MKSGDRHKGENYNRDNSLPFFSIIITTYNRSNIIKRALNSLLLQTEEDWEALIIDDGSTDDTYETAQPYFSKDTRIKYYKRFHKGEAISKNAGICLSTGRYISFLDSDDEYEPFHLAARKNIFLNNRELKFLHGGVKIIGNQYVPDRFDSSKKINLNECIIGGTFFIERDFLISLKGFRKIYLGTDADLYDRAKQTDKEIMEIRLPTYIYHHETEDSITNKLYSGQTSSDGSQNIINP
jgi:glycosyltransferase involved in cell wall biosynthesis